jgi:hypothetical protein
VRVLVACEFSGVVRDAFIAAGHDAVSCDLLPSERPGPHMQGDVLTLLDGGDWDLMIAHPPCTYLSRAGARWWKQPGRAALADEAAAFVFALRDGPIHRIAIENPIGQLNQRWRYPDQTIQPYQFGEPFSKATCLWLKNVPPLVPTQVCAEYRPLLRANTSHRHRQGIPQTGVMSGGIKSAKTFPGIAAAMASQWGGLLALERAA